MATEISAPSMIAGSSVSDRHQDRRRERGADRRAGDELPGGARLPQRAHRHAREPERGGEQQRAGHPRQREVQELGDRSRRRTRPRRSRAAIAVVMAMSAMRERGATVAARRPMAAERRWSWSGFRRGKAGTSVAALSPTLAKETSARRAMAGLPWRRDLSGAVRAIGCDSLWSACVEFDKFIALTPVVSHCTHQQAANSANCS